MPRAHEQRQSGHMHIRDWPSTERPREKLLARGAGALSDAELLAIFLGSGLKGRDAVQTARDLLQARACKLAAALELGQRHVAAELERGSTLNDPFSAGQYFARRLRAQPQEVFAGLFLDNRHRALAFEEMFRGTIDGTEVHPREVVRRALAHNAAAVIVGHNHPSGNPEPSAADRAVTERLRNALNLVDVRLLDHFVIGDGPPVSMAARGWI